MNEKQSKLCITFMYFPSLLYIKITKSKEQMSEYTNKYYQMICLILKIMRKCVFDSCFVYKLWILNPQYIDHDSLLPKWIWNCLFLGKNWTKLREYKNESMSQMTTIITSNFCCRICYKNGIVPLGKKNAEKDKTQCMRSV